jgi:hypothetical protein
MEFSFKDTLMFYQTSLRNVGLYTSISLALLGVSRFYRGKDNKVYNIIFIILSMVALFLAFSILRNLIRHVTLFRDGLKDESQKAMINEYLTISNALQYVLLTVSGLSAYTLYRQV